MLKLVFLYALLIYAILDIALVPSQECIFQYAHNEYIDVIFTGINARKRVAVKFKYPL